MKRDFRIFIDAIINSFKRIDDYIKEKEKKNFSFNRGTKDAISWNLIVIYKNHKKLPTKFKDKYSYFNWEAFERFINKIDELRIIDFNSRLDELYDHLKSNLKKNLQGLLAIREKLELDDEFTNKEIFNINDLNSKKKNEIVAFINGIKHKITPVLKKYNVKKAALFGSCIRGEMTNKSDIDILVDIDKSSFNLFIDLENELEKILKRKVDLGNYKSLKSPLKEKILKEKMEIFP